VLKPLLHHAVYVFQRVRKAMWFVTRPTTFGVHAVPLTPAGDILLVKLSYARGWRLPGGGRKPDEHPERAIIRELQEEIGLGRYGDIQKVTDFEHRPDFRKSQSSLFVVRDVVYRPKWSLEIKAVAEFDLGELPSDTAPITNRMLAEAKHLISMGSDDVD
jgi:8-oxo-dGTP pyrophosphatase MutT (NUDIX family)